MDIVSIDWNVEEFRRLISERPHPNDPGVPLEKKAGPPHVEIGSPPGTIDHEENAQSTGREATSERPTSTLTKTETGVPKKNSMSPDPVVINVMAMTVLLTEQIDEPIPLRRATDALDTALQVLNCEVTDPPHTIDQIVTCESGSASEIETTAAEVRSQQEGSAFADPAGPEAVIVANTFQPPKELQEFNRLLSGRSSPPLPVEACKAGLRSLQKAIFEPDIYTEKADRDRAIGLRWTLRDIAANRLKLSPIGDVDLQILIDLELVEQPDGAPQLTNAGGTAIAQRGPAPAW